MKFAFKREPVFVREGGSIGAVVTMENVLKCPVIFLGLSLPEHGYHAPNENFDWEQASGGMAAFTRYFGEVAALGKQSKIATPGTRPAVKAAKKAPVKKAPAKKARPAVKAKPAKKKGKK
jgi:hypothetical protein